jgi:hypothetical protein
LKTSRLPAILFSVLLAVLLAQTHARYYIAYSFAAAFVVWASTHPPKIRYLYVAAFAALLWGVRVFYHEPGASFADSAAERIFYLSAGFAGAGSLIVFSLFSSQAGGEAGWIETLAMYATPAFGLSADRWFRYMTSHPLPSLDRILFALDAKLGFQASFLTGRMFARWPLVALICAMVYRMLPVTMAYVFVRLPCRSIRLRSTYIAATASAGKVGYLAYRLCPAAGPAYAFPTLFPAETPVIAAGWVHPVDMPSSLLNAFPSLHTTWALLVLAWSQRLKMGARLLAGVLVSLTLLATLGLGEHYLIDVAVAVPFAVAAESLCTIRSVNWKSKLPIAAVCLAIFTAWVLAVRGGSAIEWRSASARVLTAATVLLPLLIRSPR